MANPNATPTSNLVELAGPGDAVARSTCYGNLKGGRRTEEGEYDERQRGGGGGGRPGPGRGGGGGGPPSPHDTTLGSGDGMPADGGSEQGQGGEGGESGESGQGEGEGEEVRADPRHQEVPGTLSNILNSRIRLLGLQERSYVRSLYRKVRNGGKEFRI